MPTTQTPVISTAGGCTLRDAGLDWDAIRVQRSVGLTALDILGARCGAAIADPMGMAVYYFVATGSADGWEVASTRILGAGHTLTVPPMRRTSEPGIHWLVCPGDGNWMTDADALRAALEDAMAPRHEAGHPA